MVSTCAAMGSMPVVERLMFQQQYIKLWIILVPKWKVISSVCLISPARTLPSSNCAHYFSSSYGGGWHHWGSHARAGPGRGRRRVGVSLTSFSSGITLWEASQKLVFRILNFPVVYRWILSRRKEQKLFGVGSLVLSIVDPSWATTSACCC